MSDGEPRTVERWLVEERPIPRRVIAPIRDPEPHPWP